MKMDQADWLNEKVLALNPKDHKHVHVITRLDMIQKGFVQVIRDNRNKVHCELQLKLYQPCDCGSGRKYKFCCYRKEDEQVS